MKFQKVSYNVHNTIVEIVYGKCRNIFASIIDRPIEIQNRGDRSDLDLDRVIKIPASVLHGDRSTRPISRFAVSHMKVIKIAIAASKWQREREDTGIYRVDGKISRNQITAFCAELHTWRSHFRFHSRPRCLHKRSLNASLSSFSLSIFLHHFSVCVYYAYVCVCVCVFRAVLRAGFSSRFGKRWEPMFARPILAARFFHLRVECQSTAMCADRQRIPSRRLRLLRDRKHSCPCIPASDCLALVA